MKCKENKSVDAEIIEKETSRGVKYILKAKCPDCDSNLSKFTKKPETEINTNETETPTPEPDTPTELNPIQLGDKLVVGFDEEIPVVDKSEIAKSK
jgi:hypothetical protein